MFSPQCNRQVIAKCFHQFFHDLEGMLIESVQDNMPFAEQLAQFLDSYNQPDSLLSRAISSLNQRLAKEAADRRLELTFTPHAAPTPEPVLFIADLGIVAETPKSRRVLLVNCHEFTGEHTDNLRFQPENGSMARCLSVLRENSIDETAAFCCFFLPPFSGRAGDQYQQEMKEAASITGTLDASFLATRWCPRHVESVDGGTTALPAIRVVDLAKVETTDHTPLDLAWCAAIAAESHRERTKAAAPMISLHSFLMDTLFWGCYGSDDYRLLRIANGERVDGKHGVIPLVVRRTLKMTLEEPAVIIRPAAIPA